MGVGEAIFDPKKARKLAKKYFENIFEKIPKIAFRSTF